ncbi:UNKNOWN [Stylonychia lemnae]|uniref:Uncharacterized protein n=1 Tax=Stylonychia lemnae TaxID=5949 RepID=A0A078AYT8_STYLE|nr:UNKNOWN [Stylonychia lemnae]|eukprot:CDW87329.1 UNKNOWN [Stylonychia lemnae]
MDSCVCVFNSLLSQFQDMIANFSAHSASTGGQSLTHDGGFGNTIPTLSGANPNLTGRFNSQSPMTDGGFFAVLLIGLFMLMMIMSNNNGAQRNSQDLKIGRQNPENRRNNRYDEDYLD